MHFFHKKDPSEWMRLKDHEIDTILAEMDRLPDFDGIKSSLAEFRNALNLLKKTKKPSFADQVHARGESLYTVFSRLKDEFKDISKESGKLSEIERYFLDHFIEVTVRDPTGRIHTWYSESKNPIILGRANVPQLSNMTSRALAELVPEGFFLKMRSVSSVPFILNDEGNKVIFKDNHAPGHDVRYGREYVVSVNMKDQFKFTVARVKDQFTKS